MAKPEQNLTEYPQQVWAAVVQSDPAEAAGAARHVMDTIEHDPQSLDRIVRWSQDNPGVMRMMRELLAKREFPSSLETIRVQYPKVIDHFDNRRVMDILGQGSAPVTRQITEVKLELLEMLGSNPVVTSIKDSEFLLRQLIKNGMESTDYQTVVASHEVFGRMVDDLDESRVLLGEKESADFQSIGQLLLAKRRMFELTGVVVSSEKGKVVEGYTYQSICDEIEAKNVLLTISKRIGSRTDQDHDWIKGLEADVHSLAEKRERLFPERYAGHPHRYGMSDHPGGPGFTPAELRDFDRSSSR